MSDQKRRALICRLMAGLETPDDLTQDEQNHLHEDLLQFLQEEHDKMSTNYLVHMNDKGMLYLIHSNGIPGWGIPNSSIDPEGYRVWCNENNIEMDYDENGRIDGVPTAAEQMKAQG